MARKRKTELPSSSHNGCPKEPDGPDESDEELRRDCDAAWTLGDVLQGNAILHTDIPRGLIELFQIPDGEPIDEPLARQLLCRLRETTGLPDVAFADVQLGIVYGILEERPPEATERWSAQQYALFAALTHARTLWEWSARADPAIAGTWYGGENIASFEASCRRLDAACANANHWTDTLPWLAVQQTREALQESGLGRKPLETVWHYAVPGCVRWSKTTGCRRITVGAMMEHGQPKIPLAA